MLVVMIAAALAAAQGAGAAAGDGRPRIVVEGFGLAESPPDRAVLAYDVQGEGRTSDQAVAALVATSSSVEKAIRSIDRSAEISSESVRVQAVRGAECKGESEYDPSFQLSTGDCAIRRYVARQDFSVRTTRVAEAGTMVGIAGRRGASRPRITSFDLSEIRAARGQAIAAALNDARSKAQLIAQASNSRLGPVLAVSLDGARDAATIVVTASRAPAPAGERDEETPIAVNVTPDPVETVARVTVSYAIQ